MGLTFVLNTSYKHLSLLTQQQVVQEKSLPVFFFLFFQNIPLCLLQKTIITEKSSSSSKCLLYSL